MSGNVADLLRDAAGRFPTSVALITGSARWTWAQLDHAADAGAAALTARGLAPGDRLLLHLPTGVELLVSLFAGARANLIVVPIDPSQPDAAKVAAKLAATAVISVSTNGFDPALYVALKEVSGWLDVHSPPQVHPETGGEDIAILARASRGGRAVMLSHRALLAAVQMILGTKKLNLRAEDRVLLVLPLFHLAGFVTAFLPLTSVGAAGVVADTPAVTGPNVVGTGAWTEFSTAVLRAIYDHRVTVIPAAPSLYRLLLRSNQLERSLAPVRLLTSAASPLNSDDAAAIRARTGSPVWEGYGISEASSVVASTLMTAAPRLRSVGLPLPGVELRIDPLDGAVAEPQTEDTDPLASIDAGTDPGRIWVRGRNLFSGYWPTGDGGPDADGWFATADIGYLDERGELHLIDRAAETFSISGFTVYPGEVEAALLTHPFIRDAAVVGLPGRGGLSLVAAVVPAGGTRPTEADMTEHLTNLLPPFKRPSAFHLMAILPRTELGRLDRDAVRAELAQALGLDLPSEESGGARLSMVSRAPAADPAGTARERTGLLRSLRRPERGKDPGAAASTAASPSKNESEEAVVDHGPSEPATGAGSGPEAEPTAATPPTDGGAASTPEAPAPLPPPEVIHVSQLDELGSRLPGVAGRSRRSALDTDSDLFGEEVLGGDGG